MKILTGNARTQGLKPETDISEFLVSAKDIFSQIIRDHRDLEERMKQIEELCSKEDFDEAKLCCLEFCSYLTAHARSEERTVYEALLRKSALKEDKEETQIHAKTLENFEEHHIADVLAEEVKNMSANDPHWKAKFMVLKESLAHHIEEEEESLKKWKHLLRREPENLDTKALLNSYLSEKDYELRKAGISYI